MQLLYKDGFIYEREEDRLSDYIFKKYAICDTYLENASLVELSNAAACELQSIISGPSEIYIEDGDRRFGILNTHTSFKLLTLEDLNEKSGLKESRVTEEELVTHVMLETLTQGKGIVWFEKLRKVFLVMGVLAGDIKVINTQQVDYTPFLSQKLTFNLYT